jgi:hypothetical protein
MEATKKPLIDGLIQMAKGLGCLTPGYEFARGTAPWRMADGTCPHCKMFKRLQQLKEEQRQATSAPK